MNIHTACSELHGAHYGQNQLKYSATYQMSFGLQDEGKKLHTKTSGPKKLTYDEVH